MKEIEVKILEIDKDKIAKKLQSLGAEKIFDGPVSQVYFDFPDGRLFREDKTLRLRKKGDVILFTYKEPLRGGNMKIMEEEEVGVDDYDATVKILNGLGLRIVRKLAKHRVSYTLGGVHFEIDTYPEFPTFLEIEGPDAKTVEKHVMLLGFTMNDAKPWSAKDLLAHYGQLGEDYAPPE